MIEADLKVFDLTRVNDKLTYPDAAQKALNWALSGRDVLITEKGNDRALITYIGSEQFSFDKTIYFTKEPPKDPKPTKNIYRVWRMSKFPVDYQAPEMDPKLLDSNINPELLKPFIYKIYENFIKENNSIMFQRFGALGWHLDNGFYRLVTRIDSTEVFTSV